MARQVDYHKKWSRILSPHVYSARIRRHSLHQPPPVVKACAMLSRVPNHDKAIGLSLGPIPSIYARYAGVIKGGCVMLIIGNRK